MAGKHRNTRNQTIALRMASGVAAAALTGIAAAAYANAFSLVSHSVAASARNSPIMTDRPQSPIEAYAVAAALFPAHAKLPHKSRKKAAVPTKVTAQDLIKLARKQIGAPSGAKYWDWYMSTPRAAQTVARDGGSIGGYAGAEWCDMFVSWVGSHAGLARTVGEDPWTVAHAKWFRSHKRWGTTPKPGAIVFFSWSGGRSMDSIDHVGIVVKDNKDGTIQTIEGNTDGGQVLAKRRDTSQVVGYGYPVYATKPSRAHAPAKPSRAHAPAQQPQASAPVGSGLWTWTDPGLS